MTDYSETFKGIHFTTRHSLSEEQIRPVIDALGGEITENLAYDHWHPEVAGPLQMAVHFLQSQGGRREKGGEMTSAEISDGLQNVIGWLMSAEAGMRKIMLVGPRPTFGLSPTEMVVTLVNLRAAVVNMAQQVEPSLELKKLRKVVTGGKLLISPATCLRARHWLSWRKT